jgi:hypothetical protein
MRPFALILVAALACSRSSGNVERTERPPETKPMTPPADAATTTGCASLLRQLVREGNLASGRGLTADCKKADADDALGTAEVGRGRLSNAERVWRKYQLGGDAVARVWLDDDGERIILVDVSHPTVSEAPDALRARLGEPAAKYQGRNNPTHEEWVYPDRGLTITIGGLYETPKNPRVSYLFVYAPTTLDDYVGRLGGKDEWVIRRPPRR